MIAEKKWYAIYTMPRWEKKVASLLIEKHINTYCPINRVLRQWSDRKKIVYEPLFRSYVFVQVSTEEMIKVRETDGVLKFVSWLNKPAVIRDAEIELIRKYLDEYMNIQVEELNMNVDDVVRIVNGPLMQYEGNVVSVGKNRVKVYLHSLRYVMVVEVDKSSIELVKKKEAPAKLPAKPLVTGSYTNYR